MKSRLNCAVEECLEVGSELFRTWNPCKTIHITCLDLLGFFQHFQWLKHIHHSSHIPLTYLKYTFDGFIRNLHILLLAYTVDPFDSIIEGNLFELEPCAPGLKSRNDLGYVVRDQTEPSIGCIFLNNLYYDKCYFFSGQIVKFVSSYRLHLK